MNLSILTNAATLKGWLRATDAPRDIISLAEQLAEAAGANVLGKGELDDRSDESDLYAWLGKRKRRNDAVLKLSDLEELSKHLEKKSIRQIARMYGVSHTTIRDFLKRAAKRRTNSLDTHIQERRLLMVAHNHPEDNAYDSLAAAPESKNTKYGKLGRAIFEKPYRPAMFREWPIHTDFRPYETTAEERGRFD